MKIFKIYFQIKFLLYPFLQPPHFEMCFYLGAALLHTYIRPVFNSGLLHNNTTYNSLHQIKYPFMHIKIEMKGQFAPLTIIIAGWLT